MATTFEFLLSCEKSARLHAESVLAEAQALVHQLECELSEFLPESPIYRLNRAQPGEPVELTPAGILLLERSARLTTQTAGAFDPTAKSAPRAGKDCGPRIGWSREISRARRLDEGARLGFGAIGKGFALDRVRELLEREGFRDYILSAGGSSLVLSGSAGPGTPWDFGWSWKRDSAGSSLGLRLKHHGEAVAIGVSGTHEKGQHILNPLGASGGPQLRSALVAVPSAADADALSTALFVSGWELNSTLASRVLEDGGVPPAMACIDAEEVPAWNGIFQRLWGSQIGHVASLALFAITSWGLSLFSLSARADEDAVDLGAMAGNNEFTPYIFDRNNWWILLPTLALFLILLHLRTNRSPKKK